MFKRLVPGLVALLACGAVLAQTKFPGIGRPATLAEVTAWDIDVRPDFTGLPKGSGSVAVGQKVWDGKCASCHGTFGESNEVFTPVVGGTTAKDIQTGKVKSLVTGDYPQRTTLMKLSTLSSLWDYINRAMPWNAPKSLTVEEVYGVTAYILHLGDILPADFVLSDANIREVQNRLPNRNGKTQLHGLWDLRGKGDVQNTACMINCAPAVVINSFLPDYARNAHGNLAEQNRNVGPVRGVDTTKPPPVAMTTGQSVPAQRPVATNPVTQSAKVIAEKQGCLACHGFDNKLVGPGLREVAKKYGGKLDASALAIRIRKGGSGNWGAVPMPEQPGLSEADARKLAEWILDGSP